MSYWKIAGLSVAGFIGVMLLGFILNGYGLIHYKFFGPRFENVRREVFENTRSYNEAKVQDLAKYRLEYMRATSEEKEALRSTIVIMFANYPIERLPTELQGFMRELHYHR